MKKTQRQVAKELKMPEYKLSRLLRGLHPPKLKEAQRLVSLVPETTLIMWLKPDPKKLRAALGLGR